MDGRPVRRLCRLGKRCGMPSRCACTDRKAGTPGNALGQGGSPSCPHKHGETMAQAIPWTSTEHLQEFPPNRPRAGEAPHRQWPIT
jgi:hypothetical protein